MHSGGAHRSTNSRKGENAGEAFFIGAFMATYQQYEYEKQAWLRRHPDATPAQIDRAFQAIARRLGL